MAKSHLITGPKVFLYINGQPYGRVVGFRWSSDTPKRAAYGLDSTEPYELMPTITRCTGQLQVLRVSRDGGAEGAGIAAPYVDLTLEKYFSILLIEQRTDTVLFQADQCSCVNQQWDVSARTFMMGTISFEALTWTNEVKPAPKPETTT